MAVAIEKDSVSTDTHSFFYTLFRSGVSAGLNIMARIFDNIDLSFTQGLQDIIVPDKGVKRVDFCVGYFNLRGWDLIIDQIDSLTGEFVE